MKSRHRLWIVVAMLGFTGCGGESTGTVSGKVSYRGTPLKGGNVIFVRTDGKPGASASIGEDGTYTMTKVPVAEGTLCVETQSLDPARFTNIPKDIKTPGKSPKEYPDPEKMAKRYVPIPLDYADPKKSSLAFTVKGGTQKYDIDLK